MPQSNNHSGQSISSLAAPFQDTPLFMLVGDRKVAACLLLAEGNPSALDGGNGFLLRLFEQSYVNGLDLYGRAYTYFLTTKLGKDKPYTNFKVEDLSRYILDRTVRDAFVLAVNEFNHSLRRSEAIGVKAPRDLYAHSAEITESYKGNPKASAFECTVVSRFYGGRAFDAAVNAACTQLSLYLASVVPALTLEFHKEVVRAGSFTTVSLESITCTVERLSPDWNFSAKDSCVAARPHDVSAALLFEAYLRSGSEAVRGLLSLSVALFSAELYKSKHGRLSRKESEKTSSDGARGPLYDVLTASFKNEKYVDTMLKDDFTVGDMLKYVEAKLSEFFGITVPESEYRALMARLEDEHTPLDAAVVDCIESYRNTQAHKLGVHRKDHKGFIETMNSRFRGRLLDLIMKRRKGAKGK